MVAPENIYPDPTDPVNILLTRYQSVNSERKCIEDLRMTRTIGIRIPKLVWSLYHEILNEEDKENIKYLVESLVLALAKERMNPIPCEDFLGRRLAYTATRITGSAHTIFNITINKNNNEVRPEVNVNVDLRGILEVVEKLYNLRKPLPPVQRKLVEQLYEKLRKVN